MALQVWLPLNGNLNNQGLAGDFTLSGNATYGSGKFGQAISTNKTNNYYTVPELNGVSNYTIAYWEKIDSSAEYSQWADLWQVQVKNGGTTSVMRDELRSTSVPGYCKVHMVKDASVGSNTNTYAGLGNDSDRAKDKWAHVAVVKDDDYVYQYINGVFDTKLACSAFEASPQTLTGYIKIGENGTNSCPAWVQDFRIYDNCLSAKEVEMLSRGLAMHYPLAPPGGENCLINSNIGITSGSNVSTVKIGVAIPIDTTVTLSVRIDADNIVWDTTSNYQRVGFETNLAKTGSSGTQYLGVWAGVSISESNNVVKAFTGSFHGRLSKTFTTLGELTTSRSVGLYIQGVKSGAVKVSNPKIELGDHATPWIPNSADTEYTTLGFNDSIEYDVSGFQYNGEKYGDLKWSNNSAKYNACYEFDGSSDYIRLKQDLYSQFRLTRDEVTVSIWAYKDDWDDYKNSGSTAQWMTMCGCQEGGGFSIYEVGNGRFTFVCGTGASSNSYKVSNTATGYADSLSSGWHMFTLTFDGLSLKGYVDGNLLVSNAFFTTKTPIYYNTGTTSIYIGVESGSGKQAGLWWKGKLSDFRVYTTALSEDAIKELFHTGQTLTNTGVLMSNEITET